MSEVPLCHPEQDAGLRIAASTYHEFSRREHAARSGLLAAEEVVLPVVVEVGGGGEGGGERGSEGEGGGYLKVKSI